MNFHILTLFPDMVENGLKTSITGRAIESGAISVEAVDIRDYTTDKHRHVDDAPYGGGAGMVIQPAPVCDAYEALCKKLGKRPRVMYMTPQGRVFNQSIAQELAKEENLVFLCGHYEGIDERALELIQADVYKRQVYYVKRVIGLPGETVEVKDGKVYINGSDTPLDEPYLPEPMEGSYGPYEVPEGCYFMMGDNRNNSLDARFWDNKFVAKNKIVAKVLFCYYPFNRIGKVD